MKTKIILGQRVNWRVRQLMKEHGIPSARALQRRLREVDNRAVGVSQFCSIVDAPPERINQRTLVGLCILFQCEIGDIIQVTLATKEEADTPSAI